MLPTEVSTELGWVPVAHACNPSYSRGRGQRITVGQIVCETLS
jgi:hypothetical protein